MTSLLGDEAPLHGEDGIGGTCPQFAHGNITRNTCAFSNRDLAVSRSAIPPSNETASIKSAASTEDKLTSREHGLESGDCAQNDVPSLASYSTTLSDNESSGGEGTSLQDTDSQHSLSLGPTNRAFPGHATNGHGRRGLSKFHLILKDIETAVSGSEVETTGNSALDMWLGEGDNPWTPLNRDGLSDFHLTLKDIETAVSGFEADTTVNAAVDMWLDDRNDLGLH